MEKVTVEELRMILKYISKGYKVPDIVYNTILKVAKIEVEDAHHAVIIKRDPNIGRERASGVYVKIIEDNTMHIHPATVENFGADFDGDAMNIFRLLSDEGENEIKTKMMTTVTNDKVNAPNFALTKEMIDGLFVLTWKVGTNIPKKIYDHKELADMHIKDLVEIVFRGKRIINSVGRIIFNLNLPDYVPFVDEPVSKKVLSNIFSNIISVSKSDFAATLDKLMKISFKYCTLYPQSIDLQNLEIPESLYKLKEQLATEKSLLKQQEILNLMETKLLEYLKENVPNLYISTASGAARGTSQLRQIMVAKGLITDPVGNISLIQKDMNSGYTPQEYFDAAPSSRAGIISRVLNTAHGGYEYRKMIYCVGNVLGDINKADCGTKRTLNVKLTPELFARLGGRYIQDPKTGYISRVTSKMVGKIIPLRSPIYCKSTDICRTCYGDLIYQVKSKNIGIVAAQQVASLSERIMKCSDGLVHQDGKLIPFIDLWNSIESPAITQGNVETKDFISEISGINGNIKTSYIQKHPANDKMLFISTKSGNTLICQSNHPLWVKKNNIHSKYENKTVRLVGESLYSTTGTGRSKTFATLDNEMIEKEAGELEKYNSIWVDNSIAMNNKSSIIPEINPYLCGIQCSKEGTKIWKDRFISGECSYEKRLNPEFINYDKQWLLDFLAGLIDSDGTVINTPGTCCRIYTESYYLVQQLKAICLKVGLRMNTNLVSRSNLTKKNTTVSKRPQFTCDIRFHADSPIINSKKIKASGEIIRNTGNYKDEYPLIGFDVITGIKEISNWNYPVFDIKTETKEFMLGCVQNHNSFHTGGAATILQTDILNELGREIEDEDIPLLKQVCYQDGQDLITKRMTSIKINKDIYTEDFKIKKDESQTKYILGAAVFTILFDKFKVVVNINQPAEVYITEDTTETDNEISIVYPPNSKILKINPSVVNVTKAVQYIDKIAGGKIPTLSPEGLYKTFFDHLKSYGGFDSVHLEVMVSNFLRNRTNPQLPARLKEPYDYKMFSVKKLPALISYPLALAFENLGSALQYSLIADRGDPSPIEKVLFGESLSDLAKSQLKDRGGR